jgi:hypothetical protein
MKRPVESHQRGVTDIEVWVDGSAVGGGTLTTDGLTMGSEHVLITENSGGNYTITLNEPGSRACFAVATAVGAVGGAGDVTTMRIISSDASTVVVEQVGADQTTPSADGDFTVLIRRFDSADET